MLPHLRALGGRKCCFDCTRVSLCGELRSPAAFCGATRHLNQESTHSQLRTMDALIATARWYGLGFQREGHHALRVHTRESGYTRAQVLAALHSIAESVGCALVVLPVPAAQAGELHVAVQVVGNEGGGLCVNALPTRPPQCQALR